MLKLNLSPVRSDESQPIVSVAGDILTINGEDFDFSVIPDGATLPADGIESDWIVGGVSRVDGEIELTVKLPHGANAPESTRFPAPIINPDDGAIMLPAYNA